MKRALWSLLLLSACATDVEGDEAGECEDGADNDANGLFDCDDPGCAGAPTCDATDTTDTQDTDLTDTDLTDTDDGLPPGARRPGPHPEEFGLASAWEILEETVDTTLDPVCVPVDDTWRSVYAAPVSGDSFHYTFLRVDDATEATGLACGSGFPGDCTEKDLTWDISDHALTTVLPVVTVQPQPALLPNCEVQSESEVILEDRGEFGTITYFTEISVTAACPSDLQANDGCTINHVYDLDWNRAE